MREHGGRYHAAVKGDDDILGLQTAVLGRGFSITRDSSGALLRDAAKIGEGENIVTTLAKGSIESKVLKR